MGLPAGGARYDGGGDSGTPDNSGGDGPRSTPSFNNGRVYVPNAYLTLYCFDAKNGDIVWTKDVLNTHAGQLVAWQSTASPLVEGDLVFIMGGGEGQALLAFGPPVDADLDQPVAEVCTGEKLGTTIAWYDDSQLAARLAREQGKLVFLIQVSGNFAREEFT